MPGRMHQVELVEAADEPVRSPSARVPGGRVDVALDEDAPERRTDDVLAARTWLRRHARTLVPTAAVLAATLLVTQLVIDRREAARLAALAAIPGVVPPADSSIGVIWRAEARLAAALQSGAMVDGVLVGGIQDADGAPSVVGLDPDTGAVAWITPVDLPTPQPTPTSSSPELWIACSAVRHEGSHVAACVSQQYGEGVQGIPSSAVWVLDPDDGRLLAERVVDGGSGLAFTDDAMVVVERVTDDGSPARPDADAVRWAVTATDPVGGDTRWTWSSPLSGVVSRDDGPEGLSGTSGASLQTHEDRVVVGIDDHAWILTSDGELVRDVPLEPASWLQPARAGVFIKSTWTSSDLYQGALVLENGTQVPIDETAGWLAVDDGSAPDVVLTVGEGGQGTDGLSGRSARTGERIWHLPGTIVAALMLDGTLYVATSDSLRALDATTGEVLWRTPLERLAHQLATDGTYLLVPGLGVTLEAYSLRDGTLAWSTDLSEEVAGDRSTVFVQGFRSGWHDPRLYVWMDSGSVAVLG
ncbi:PQQ-binding-like beta-propeller repeat protein [Cellulomonas sp.]|uniref:outer membrane protein assembly factor BamB family protein n=1 Tax=Cellulomonas sp. TaxID=40001 RepID=UPI003BA90F15